VRNGTRPVKYSEEKIIRATHRKIMSAAVHNRSVG
jgi:hypothetical protein